MTTFTPALLAPWQLAIAALYKQLALDIAAIHAVNARACDGGPAALTAKEPNEK